MLLAFSSALPSNSNAQQDKTFELHVLYNSIVIPNLSLNDCKEKGQVYNDSGKVTQCVSSDGKYFHMYPAHYNNNRPKN